MLGPLSGPRAEVLRGPSEGADPCGPCGLQGMAHKLYGNNMVFCQGRFISGPDSRSCIASLLMIVAPSIIWQVVVGAWFAARYSLVFPIFAGFVQVGSLGFLLATAFSDPGIMPRQKDFTEHYDARTKTFRTKQPPRYYDLILRGHPFKLKYCTTCNIYRPPRCTHCSVCENCIERFDHHCPWIGNCIGKRNYWLFYSFVSFTGTLNSFVLATSIAQITVLCRDYQDLDGRTSGDALVLAMREQPLSAALVVYSAAIVWFTVGLCMYHNYLICTNQTTYEQIKGVYSNGNNPFHRGIVGNCGDVLCSRVRPRYFNAFTGRMLWPKATSESASELKQSLSPEGDGQNADVADPSSVDKQGPRSVAQEEVEEISGHVVREL